VLAATPPDKLTGDARRAQEEWIAAGGARIPSRPTRCRFGRHRRCVVRHGFHAPARAETLAVIRAINAAKRPVLRSTSLGLDADTGAVHEEAVRAEITLSFVGYKPAVPRRRCGTRGRGAARRPRRGGAGAARVRAAHAPHRRVGDRAGTAARARDAHKGRTAACWCRRWAGMPGARARGQRALRVGAGLVTVAGARRTSPR
jgi:NAD(P)H-hydrate epimerase